MDEKKILDKGFVYLVDSMGGDAAVVQAARVSYDSSGLSTPKRDAKLIKHLWNNHHGTPFEHATFKFHIKCPIFVARQWFRHRMSSYNELSRRYTEIDIKIGSTAEDEFHVPETWRIQDKKNKQGSTAPEDKPKEWHDAWTLKTEQMCRTAMSLYREMVDAGVAKEMARMVLPVNLYTEFYWTVNARALLHFVGLRSHNHAQAEIQPYSNAMFAIMALKMPWTAAAFLDGIKLEEYPDIPRRMDKPEEETAECSS